MYFKPITDCFPLIEARFSEKDIRKFVNTPYNDLCLYHFGLGTWIRNELLTESSEPMNFFRAAGIDDKDEMSFFIIRLFYMHKKTD